jgi:uncharacterized protein (TIGR01370 family)
MLAEARQRRCGPGQTLSVGRRALAPLLGLAAWSSSSRDTAGQTDMTRFLVYYGMADDPAIGTYDVAVLDAEAGDALLARRAEGAVFLGYVSLGEADSRRAHFPAIAEQGLLVEPNPHWPDAWFVDLRDERWRRFVLEQLVPAALDRGFQGVFLDTLDDAEFLERRDPARFAGMVERAADLVRSLRRRYPEAKIMMNRGYALLPRIAGEFDMLLGESVRATYSRGSGSCSLLPPAEYEWQRAMMWEARRLHPALRLFSLDYWDPDDAEGIARIYAEQRDNGFVPYVATPDLARVVPAPGRVPP